MKDGELGLGKLARLLVLAGIVSLLNACGGGGGSAPPPTTPTTPTITFNVPELMYYTFDGTGVSVPNLASAPVGSNPATIEGAMTQGGSGLFGGGLIGSGGSAATDRLNTGWATDLTSDWTISLYLDNINAGGLVKYIFGDGSAGSFRCFTEGVAGTGNLILRGIGITDVTATGAALASPTVTHFVYDATVPEIRAYVNGVLNNTVAQAGPLTITGAGPFTVGAYSNLSGLPAAGVLDEFRMYNRALSAAEITATFDAALPK